MNKVTVPAKPGCVGMALWPSVLAMSSPLVWMPHLDTQRNTVQPLSARHLLAKLGTLPWRRDPGAHVGSVVRTYSPAAHPEGHGQQGLALLNEAGITTVCEDLDPRGGNDNDGSRSQRSRVGRRGGQVLATVVRRRGVAVRERPS